MVHNTLLMSVNDLDQVTDCMAGRTFATVDTFANRYYVVSLAHPIFLLVPPRSDLDA